MRYSTTVGILFLFGTGLLLGAEHQKPSGTSTSISLVNGVMLQRTETIPDINPLPAGTNILEQQRSVSLPNSRSYNSLVRWVSTDAAAIGQDVAVSASGQNQFIGWNLNNLRVSFHENASSTPLWEYASDPNTYRNFVALSANSNVIANSSYHNIYLFDKASGSVIFNFPVPNARTAGPIAVSRDGQLLVCACSSPLTGGMHRVYAFNPPSTTPIWTFDFSDAQSTGIYGINISIDKSTVAVNGKFYTWILNASDGTVRTQMEIANTESRVALSSDASVLVIAELSGFIKAYSYNSTESRYDLLWMYRVPPGATTNWASAIDVSADGLTIMAGTLIFADLGQGIYDGSVYLFDTFGEGTPNWIFTGLGDEVSGVALSDDGSMGAATTWGDYYNPSKPTIFVFERSSNQPVFSVVSPGSMFSLAMSADGKTVVAGGKHVHARTFGNGGDVYNIAVDLGGGAISGTILLSGALPNHSGTTVQVVGTTRTTTTLPDGRFVVSNVPPGTYSVRASHLGFIAHTFTGITVSGTDTTQNVNTTLAQTGAPPSNLVASHSLDSRIQLSWTNPSQAANRAFEKLLATDAVSVTDASTQSVAGRRANVSNTPAHQSVGVRSNDLVPPDSIKIYRAIRTGGPYYLKRVLAGSQSSYTDSTAMPLKNYYYRATAIYGQGESVYSNEAFGSVDSSFLQFAFTTPHRTVAPTIDGVISPGEWNDAIKIDVSDVFGNGGGVNLPRGSTFMWFKYDSIASKLYIAGEDFLNNDGLSPNEGFGLYFDDNHNRQFEPIGTDPLLREGNYWGYYFTSGSTVRFREIYTGGGVNAIVDTVFDAQIAFSNAAGHVTGEVSIPLSFFDKNHLQVYGPDKTVGAGLFMIGRTSGGSAIFHGWWPQTMISVFTPSGFGDIKIPIRLLAPPRAPSNIAVARQGSYLHLTWTDPTLGINGDPMTVPATLQLYRNDVLWREFPLGVQTWTDSNVAPQGWYEYKMRGYINVAERQTQYFGPYSNPVGAFAVSDPQLTEMIYDDGIPNVFYVVDFSYNGNQFAIRFTPQQYPAKVYRVKAFTNNGNSPILVAIHADSAGLPGPMLAGNYTGVSHQTSGVDSFLVTLPGTDPPTIASGSFWVLLKYLPTRPGAPGIGGDYDQPIDGQSYYYTYSSGWTNLTNVDLMVRAFITGQTASVSDEPQLPKVFALSQNYPNPFNPSTKISFEVPTQSRVSIKVFDVLGREVATLVNEEKQPGRYSSTWDANGAASGVYFYRMTAGSFSDVKKLLLLR